MCSCRKSPYSFHSLHRRNWKFLGSKNFQNGEGLLERIPSKGICGYFLELHNGFIYCLREGGGGGGCGGVRFEIQERSQVVFKVIKRSDIQILFKDLKG